MLSLLMTLRLLWMIEEIIMTDGKYATSVQGVFVAGDAMTGASLVARAMRHGREAAGACHAYLVQVN